MTGPTRAYELDRRHVFHSWSAQAEIAPMEITSAEGSTVWDADGRSYLDFSSQLVFTNLGHQHPRVVEAIQRQAATLCTVAPAHVNAARSEAARLIAERMPEGLEKVFFTNGGADAIEHAVRMARLATGRPKVLTAYRSYHGGTQTAINLTGDPRRFPNDQGAAGVSRFFGPFLYRSEFHAETEEQEEERALQHLRRTLEAEGPATVAAIVLETVPGTAGVMVPPPGYLAGVRRLCDEHGVLLVLDEVMAGFGRTGAWLALDHWGVRPDLVTFAKGVNSGYVPMGGVAIADHVAEVFDHRAYPGGLTYSGHPLAAAAAVATLETMAEDGVVEHAAALGADVLGPGLAAIAERHPCVGDVRGLGVFWAVELVADQETRTPMDMGPVLAACKSLGLLPFATANRIHLVPPCTTTAAEAQEGLDILDRALKAGDELLG